MDFMDATDAIYQFSRINQINGPFIGEVMQSIKRLSLSTRFMFRTSFYVLVSRRKSPKLLSVGIEEEKESKHN